MILTIINRKKNSSMILPDQGKDECYPQDDDACGDDDGCWAADTGGSGCFHHRYAFQPKAVGILNTIVANLNRKMQNRREWIVCYNFSPKFWCFSISLHFFIQLFFKLSTHHQLFSL